MRMSFAEANMTRRHSLLVASLVLCPLEAAAQTPSRPQRESMPPSVRLATLKDLPAIVPLLIQDAKARSSLDPVLWRIAGDAPARIATAASAALNGPQALARELWLVAEHAGRIVGVAHAMLVPVPPIYDG